MPGSLQLRGQFDGGNPGKATYSTPLQDVSVGDIIYGTLILVAGGTPYGDEWGIEVYDQTTGLSEGFDYYTGTAAPFNKAWYTVLESDALYACDGLSESNYTDFFLLGLGQESPTDETAYISVIDEQSWTNSKKGSSFLPYCTWAAGSFISPDHYAEIDWAY